MLYLVGIGLGDDDMPLAALDVCRRSDVYIDTYTSIVDEKRLAHIAGLVGKTPKALARHDLEEGAGALLEKARDSDVAVLVGGDPLTATTHKTLFIDAKRIGMRVKVIHAASILSAIIGESGLDFYRFGALCTISRWSEHYRPVSFYETIGRNHSNNMHSVVLLDYDADSNSSMDIAEAVGILEKAEEHYKRGIISGNMKIIVLHNIARDGQAIAVMSVAAAGKLKFNNGVTSLVVPAALTDIERESMEGMYGD